jgi:protein TonB
MSLNTPSPTLRWAVALALGLSLAACGKKEAPAPAATSAVAQQQQAAEAAAAQQAAQQAAALAALSADELRTRGRAALREKRIYAPAGDNAMEYYIALRKKSDKPDASAESALIDLQPYAVIAAEQAIGRDDYIEAERLRALIAAADPNAPSLARIADAIAKGKAGAAQKIADAAALAEQQAKAAEEAKKRAADLAAQQADAERTAAAAPRPTTAAPAAPTPQPTAPPPVAATPTPTPAAPTPAPSSPRSSSSLVAVSTPQPPYPPDALRKGQVGEVVLEFVVNPDGSVGNIDVVSARPRGVFERGVQATVRRWRFQPVSSPQTVRRTFTFAQ